MKARWSHCTLYLINFNCFYFHYFGESRRIRPFRDPAAADLAHGPKSLTTPVLLLAVYYSGIRLINPRLINPAAYYIQFAWNGIVPILSRYFKKRRLLKPPRIKSKTGCPEVDLLTEFHCITYVNNLFIALICVAKIFYPLIISNQNAIYGFFLL